MQRLAPLCQSVAPSYQDSYAWIAYAKAMVGVRRNTPNTSPSERWPDLIILRFINTFLMPSLASSVDNGEANHSITTLYCASTAATVICKLNTSAGLELLQLVVRPGSAPVAAAVPPASVGPGLASFGGSLLCLQRKTPRVAA